MDRNPVAHLFGPIGAVGETHRRLSEQDERHGRCADLRGLPPPCDSSVHYRFSPFRFVSFLPLPGSGAVDWRISDAPRNEQCGLRLSFLE
jgi:hypothetical protein